MIRTKAITVPMVEDFSLIKLIQDEYRTSGLTDFQFAEHACKKLNLSVQINATHIMNRRKAFDIESNRDTKIKENKEKVKENMRNKQELLQSKVLILESKLKNLCNSLGVSFESI